jgi:hypothetical protein
VRAALPAAVINPTGLLMCRDASCPTAAIVPPDSSAHRDASCSPTVHRAGESLSEPCGRNALASRSPVSFATSGLNVVGSSDPAIRFHAIAGTIAPAGVNFLTLTATCLLRTSRRNSTTVDG